MLLQMAKDGIARMQTLSLGLRNAVIATLLIFSVAAIQIVCTVYVNAIYLTTYPKSWLPYFFIIQAAVDVIAFFVLFPFLKQISVKKSVFLQVTLGVMLATCIVLLRMGMPLAALVFSFVLMATNILFWVIAWGNVRLVFDMIEYKSMANVLTLAATLGTLTFSMLISYLIKRYGINILDFILLFLIATSCVLLSVLKVLSMVSKQTKRGVIPLKYPLYQKLFLASFLIAASYTLIDYCFKIELNISFSREEIGIFISHLMGVASAVEFILIIATTKLINRLKVVHILIILPVYWLIVGGVSLFHPTLYNIALLQAGRYILYYSVFNIGRELTLNVLPAQIRLLSQFQLKSIASTTAGVSVAILLLLVEKYLSIVEIIGSVIVLNFLVLFIIVKINKSYISTLKEEFNLKRFDIGGELARQNIELIKQIVLQGFVSADIDQIRFVLNLLPNLQLTTLPSVVLAHIDSEAADVRLSVIKYVAYYKAKEAIPVLLKRLPQEHDQEIVWQILHTIAQLNPTVLLEWARAALGSDHNPSVRAGAIRILVAAGNIDDYAKATNVLREMLYDTSAAVRSAAVRVLAVAPFGNFKHELTDLTMSSDATISGYAIRAIINLRLYDLAPIIVARISKGGVYHKVSDILPQLGPKMVAPLVQAISTFQGKEHSHLSNLIKAFVGLPMSDIENNIDLLTKHKNILARNFFAREMAYYACKATFSKLLNEKIYNIILSEIDLIIGLNQLQRYYTKNYMSVEVGARKYLAKLRLLYWLIAYTQNGDIFNLISPIFTGIQTERAKSLELLGSFIAKRNLVDPIYNIFSHKIPRVSLDKETEKNILDDWLQQVVNMPDKVPAGTHLDIIQKVFVLRSVELFKQLPAETLLVIAEKTSIIEMRKGHRVFSEGDPPTGLFIVVSGKVDIVKQGKTITFFQKHDFFGELALIDNSNRSTSAFAKTDSILLFLERNTFESLTDDLPEVLKAVMLVIMRYLRQYMTK